MAKKNPENMDNPIVAMNFYNGGSSPSKKRKRQKKWVCPECKESIPDGYVDCLNNCLSRRKPKPATKENKNGL